MRQLASIIHPCADRAHCDSENMAIKTREIRDLFSLSLHFAAAIRRKLRRRDDERGAHLSLCDCSLIVWESGALLAIVPWRVSEPARVSFSCGQFASPAASASLSLSLVRHQSHRLLYFAFCIHAGVRVSTNAYTLGACACIPCASVHTAAPHYGKLNCEICMRPLCGAAW
jgi:hypothetical protein